MMENLFQTRGWEGEEPQGGGGPPPLGEPPFSSVDTNKIKYIIYFFNNI